MVYNRGMETDKGLRGFTPDVHKVESIDRIERAAILALQDVLRPKPSSDKQMKAVRDARERLYNFEKEYTDKGGRAFSTKNETGVINGFIGVKKEADGSFVIDQIGVDARQSGASEIVRALVEKVIASAPEERVSKIRLVISDASEFEHVLEEFDFHQVDAAGGDRSLEKRF